MRIAHNSLLLVFASKSALFSGSNYFYFCDFIQKNWRTSLSFGKILLRLLPVCRKKLKKEKKKGDKDSYDNPVIRDYQEKQHENFEPPGPTFAELW